MGRLPGMIFRGMVRVLCDVGSRVWRVKRHGELKCSDTGTGWESQAVHVVSGCRVRATTANAVGLANPREGTLAFVLE